MKHLPAILLLLPLFAWSQRKDTVLKYLDQNLQFTTKENAVCFGVAVKQPAGWFLLALYPDTTPVLKVYYKDRALKVLHGAYASFYPKYRNAYSGFYENNKKTGVWQSWYENGQRKDSGSYTNNIRTGTWKQWHDNGMPASVSSFLTTLTPEEMQRRYTQCRIGGAARSRRCIWHEAAGSGHGRLGTVGPAACVIGESGTTVNPTVNAPSERA